jgi:flagellar biosynthesis GTPase FlhF
MLVNMLDETPMAMPVVLTDWAEENEATPGLYQDPTAASAPPPMSGEAKDPAKMKLDSTSSDEDDQRSAGDCGDSGSDDGNGKATPLPQYPHPAWFREYDGFSAEDCSLYEQQPIPSKIVHVMLPEANAALAQRKLDSPLTCELTLNESIITIQEFVAQGREQAAGFVGKSLLAVMGNTGCGKSTTLVSWYAS